MLLFLGVFEWLSLKFDIPWSTYNTKFLQLFFVSTLLYVDLKLSQLERPDWQQPCYVLENLPSFWHNSSFAVSSSFFSLMIYLLGSFYVRLCESWTGDIQEARVFIRWSGFVEGLCWRPSYVAKSPSSMEIGLDFQAQRSSDVDTLGRWRHKSSSWRPWSPSWPQNRYPCIWELNGDEISFTSF